MSDVKCRMSNVQNGFTLIELLLYIAISSVMLLVISIFLSVMLQARVKNQTITEVESQGAIVAQIIAQTVRNATAVNTPTAGTSAAALSLAMPAAGANPTIFSDSGAMVLIQEGAGSPAALTNSRVQVTGLTFRNLSRAGTHGIVSFTFTVQYINQTGRNEYNYSKNFYGSASIR